MASSSKSFHESISSNDTSCSTSDSDEDSYSSILLANQIKIEIYETRIKDLEYALKHLNLEKELHVDGHILGSEPIIDHELVELKLSQLLKKYVTERTQLADLLYKLFSESRRNGYQSEGYQKLSGIFSELNSVSREIIRVQQETRGIDDQMINNILQLRALTERKSLLLSRIENIKKTQPSILPKDQPEPELLKRQKELAAIKSLAKSVVIMSQIDWINDPEFADVILSWGDLSD